MERVAGLRVGTETMSRLAGSRAKPPGRHGGDADECPRHVPDVVTVDGANHALHRRAHRRLTREGFPFYYPLLVTHILFGSVALLAGCTQVWPWFRHRYPAAHRTIGRVYVFGGVLPAGIAVLGVAPLSSTGFVSQVGNTMLALLWLPITIAGYRMARQRRFAEHREWMIRSFALTTSIVVNRLWLVLLLLVLWPQVDTTFGGDQTAMINTAAAASVWLSWVVNLLLAEWWLQRGRAARHRALQ